MFFFFQKITKWLLQIKLDFKLLFDWNILQTVRQVLKIRPYVCNIALLPVCLPISTLTQKGIWIQHFDLIEQQMRHRVRGVRVVLRKTGILLYIFFHFILILNQNLKKKLVKVRLRLYITKFYSHSACCGWKSLLLYIFILSDLN